ncbi:hypothetical protein GCM10022251_14220 [Phytohabitans flavus]|uniref:anti-sigma-D factor RsdA n=1 Tax=Phytohabitans flavus TaxID=1076124 RepID=UPI0031ED72BF
MTDQRGKADKPVSVAQIAADDRLLDALGRGDPFDGDPATDPAATMLATWRADLDGDPVDALPDDAFLAALDDEPAPLRAGDPGRKRRLVQAVLGAAAAAVVAVGLAVSAHQAQPGSVLWPVSKVVYPQRAEVKAAEQAIADARAALAAGRTADAQALLATAQAHIAHIGDGATAARLLAEVDALLRALSAATVPAPPPTPATPAPAPTTAPAPRTSQSAPGGSSGSKPVPPPEGGDPTPEPSESSRGLLPLPTPLLPLPPLPLPSLPPILPGGD